MKHSILLTGGAGYIGSHTYVALVNAGYDVVILDNFSNSKRPIIKRLKQITKQKKIFCYTGSIENPHILKQIFSDHDISAVIHFAAKKSVNESIVQPLEYTRCNFLGLVNLLEQMEVASIKKMVFSSSATIYGNTDGHKIDETATRSYANPYGFTKLIGEQLVEQVAASSDSIFGILRYFNPVGAHPSGLIGEDPIGQPSNVMPLLAQVASGVFPHLKVFGADFSTPDGTGVRDYIHVADLAEGHVASLKGLFETGQGHTINLGTGIGTSVLDLVNTFEAVNGCSVPTLISERRPGDVAACVADPQKALDVLGFKTHHDLADMCRSAWQWEKRRSL
tara:strand:+ start:3925 stop:4932 length:1008 start_codon:yes stop_codon:yes gene_type:complete